MKITRKNSNDCGGFKPPKGHLDTQMFPECEDTETDRNIVKKNQEKKKKKAFNLMEYRTAEINRYKDDTGAVIEGPDMQSLNFSQIELLKEKLEKRYPRMTWTGKAIVEWFNKNIRGKYGDFTGPKDIEHFFR